MPTPGAPKASSTAPVKKKARATCIVREDTPQATPLLSVSGGFGWIIKALPLLPLPTRVCSPARHHRLLGTPERFHPLKVEGTGRGLLLEGHPPSMRPALECCEPTPSATCSGREPQLLAVANYGHRRECRELRGDSQGPNRICHGSELPRATLKKMPPDQAPGF